MNKVMVKGTTNAVEQSSTVEEHLHVGATEVHQSEECNAPNICKDIPKRILNNLG